MKHKRLIAIIIICSLMLTSCAHYTYEDAKSRIEPIPSVPQEQAIPTKLSDIKAIRAAETARLKAILDAAQAKETEERTAQEQAEAAALEQERTALEQQQAEQARLAAEQERLVQEQLAAQEAEARRQEEIRQEALKLATQMESERISAQIEAMRQAQVAEEQRQAQIKAEEAARLAAEQEAQRIQQEAADAEAVRLAAEAAAKLVAPVPPVSQIIYPYSYQPQSEYQQIEAKVPTFTTLFIPMPLEALGEQDALTLALDISKSISDIHADIIILSGNPGNVIPVVNAVGRNATVLPEGAIITNFQVKSIEEDGVVVTPVQGKDLQLQVITMDDPQVLQLVGTETWKETASALAPGRAEQATAMIGRTRNDIPVIAGASLMEPSSLDWTSFSPVPYRSSYAWPLSILFEDAGFNDSYRLTHYSEETDAGTTYKLANGSLVITERLDYLFTQRLMPLDTTVLSLGRLSLPQKEQIPERHALLGTYILP